MTWATPFSVDLVNIRHGDLRLTCRETRCIGDQLGPVLARPARNGGTQLDAVNATSRCRSPNRPSSIRTALSFSSSVSRGTLAPEGPAGRGSTKDRRTRNRELREKLQKKGTKSAKRLLRKRARTESRFGADINHQISKRIVAEAERTGRGIAIEELAGIRARVRLRKPQRATHSSWAFAQLGTFLTYKAEEAGVPLVQVNPAYTSQRCTACGHTDKKNRTTQAEFLCQKCGFVEHADLVGADNIALLAPPTYWALSTVPSVA